MIDKNLDEEMESLGFKIQKLIGRGGYANVYSVLWNQYPGQTFVAKIINLANTSMREDKEKSFSNEISTLSCLFHKNIINIYRHFKINDSLVIIMEYCPNKSLQDYIQTHGPMNIDDFRIIAQQCLEAVKCCHENGIAHRDIKPNNILFGENYNVKLCDFGISEIMDEGYSSRHDGSVLYISPEMVGREPYDPKKSDIWSLGITFYCMATNQIPWAGRNKEEVKAEIVVKNIVFPNDTPSIIKSLICAMTRKTPRDRPSAEQLLKHCIFMPLPSLQTHQIGSQGNLNKLTKNKKIRASASILQYSLMGLGQGIKTGRPIEMIRKRRQSFGD